MTTLRKISIITAAATTALAGSIWAASDGRHDSHGPMAGGAIQVAQAMPGGHAPGMGGGMATTPGYADQMKAMQEMHAKMQSAKTPQQHSALMAEQMKVMQNGMGMMGHMGGAAMAGKPGDMPARQDLMEQRMELMQSMMQMMMDRMPQIPATK